MAEANAQVFVVDDDLSIREALGSLVRSAGLKVQTVGLGVFGLERSNVPGCLVLDVHLPGLDLQSALTKTDPQDR